MSHGEEDEAERASLRGLREREPPARSSPRGESEWSWALLPQLENKTPPRDCLEFTTENFERIVLPPALRGRSKDEWLLDNRTSQAHERSGRFVYGHAW